MNRFPKGLLLAGLAALALVMSACDITSLNENPNESGTVTTPNLLANAQNDLATTYWDDYPGGFWVRYAQYWTTNQYTDSDRYQFPTRRGGSNDANWEGLYLIQNDLQEIIRINRDEARAGDAAAFGPNENQIAIAMIMQAFTYQMMTDVWGPIPYDGALQARSGGSAPDSVRFSPAYTAQEEIYRGLIDSLTAASDMISPGEDALASSDLVFGGDMELWKKLANSLKMRVAIRAADQIPDVAGPAIQEALDAGVMESNADAAAIPFSGAPPYQNPFFENYEVDGRDDWAAPEPILGLMNEVSDPRRGAYFTDSNPNLPGDQFNPFPYGLEGGNAQALFTSPNQFFSRPSERVRGDAAAPAYIMLYDEVLFTQAEAAERGYIDGNPESLYEDAIRASLNYWDSGENAGDYIDNVPYDNSGGWAPEGAPGETWEHTLGIQKWLALYLQGIQGWSEWRRLDFQEVLQVPEGDPGSELFGCTFPVRMSYPDTELSLNQRNLDDAVDQYFNGANDQGQALWWDVETPGCEGS